MNTKLFYQMLRKILRIWPIGAFITAIFILAAGIVFKYSEIDFKNNAEKISAEIVGSTNYGYPVIAYTVDGNEYRISSRSLIPEAQIGDKVEIQYHKNDPSNAQIGENPIYQISIWLIALGAASSIVLAVLLFKKKPL